ncbi:acyltransferase family protein [Paenibacillus rhizovicinus]|uniref:Acyltransferase family protein n=1 Tax=Paenibacillus rhizovicinus TaxID=2704463 RepID=A0A6C0NYK2_9BACL|nr:acyltransferase family protein [Paenibacillus rhizovicinus]QHW31324.1 acyltransferase family protein [Paenibacillus rhizovicinus]
MPRPIGSSRYMPGLDGLRAIAVFAVIAYHLNLSWVPGGLLGVGIFFVLSGYLITDILLKQHAKAGKLDLRDFWIRRARRLLPAMMIMLALVSSWLLVADPGRLASMKGEIVSALLYYSNWRLIFHDVSYFESFGPPSPLGHLWSLAVEEQFYLIWPLALVFLIRSVKRRGRLLFLILAGAAASAGAMAMLYVPGLDPSRVYYGTDTRAFGLLIGAALAVVWPSWKLSASISRRGSMAVDAVGTGGLIVVALMIALVGEYDAFLYRGGMVLLSIATAAVVAAMAHPASRLARLIGSKPLQWFGARSYGIYLYHYPVIALSTPMAQVDEFHPLRALLQILASIALAELSWRFIEEPIRQGAIGKLRSRLADGVQGRQIGRKRGVMLACICALIITSVSCSSQNNLVQGDNGSGQTGKGQLTAGGTSGGQDAGIIQTGDQGGTAPNNNGTGTDHQAGEDGSDGNSAGSGTAGNAGSNNGAGADGTEGTGNSKPGASDGGTAAPDQNGAGDAGDQGGAGGSTGPGAGNTAGSGANGSTDASGGNGSSGGGTGIIGSGSGGSADTGSSGGTAGGGSTGGTNGKPDSSAGNGTPPAANTGGDNGNGTIPVQPPAELPIAKDGITVIGDSVILDAKPFLEKLVKGIVVEGKVGRQMAQADDVIADLKKRNQLGKTVVIELGTNGSFSQKQLDELIAAIGSDRTIYFINTRVPRKWQDVVNEMLSDTIAATANTKLIDWYTASKGHDDFFGKDGVHLKRSGGEFFANLIVSALK